MSPKILLTTLAAGVIALTSFGFSAPADAQPSWRDRDRDRWRDSRRYYRPPPPPRYYAPPVYYAPPPPVYYAPPRYVAPRPQPGVGFGFWVN
jgi:hypothetical protein